MSSFHHFNPLLSEEKLHAVISLLFIPSRLPTLYFSAILINLMKQIRCQLTWKKKPPHIHNHWSLFDWKSSKASFRSPASQEEEKKNHLPTLMRLADRKWLQGTLAVLMKESPSVVTVVLDFSDGLGESVTMAILAATESMSAAGWWTGPTDQTEAALTDSHTEM